MADLPLSYLFFEGSYSEYEEKKQKRLGKEEPTRVRYRKHMND